MKMTMERPNIVLIGCSAGGFETLGRILPPLQVGYPLPIVIVLHVPPDSGTILAESFARKCSLRAKEAEDKEAILPGVIYFAPPNYHLMVEAEGEFSLSTEEPVHFSRPSIDVLFESAAMAFGSQVAAFLLTGANADGASGLRQIAEKGGRVVIQDPETAPYRSMPDAGLATWPNAEVMTVEEIMELLLAWGKKDA